MSVNKQIAIIIWTICLISNAVCIQVNESEEEESFSNVNTNTTTLYPVDKSPFITTTTERIKENKMPGKKSNPETVTWNINTTFARPKEVNEDYEDMYEQVRFDEMRETGGENDEELRVAKNENDGNKILKAISFTFPNEDKSKADLSKVKTVSNKANENITNSKADGKGKTSDKEFKPSPHLGSYYDTIEDSPVWSFTSHTQPTVKPTSVFVGSPRDQFEPEQKKIPEEFIAFPYSYDNGARAHGNAEWSTHGLQSKPTVQAPVRIPAGGLYKHHYILKEKPTSYGDDSDFDLESYDYPKDYSMKKRPNPWKSLLHLVTALLPVGLLVSALTPRVIAVHGTGLESPASPCLTEDPLPTTNIYYCTFRIPSAVVNCAGDIIVPNIKRTSRLLSDSAGFPSVSEQCKRRLLCEIHSETNYSKNRSPHQRPKLCYKIRCEDPHAVSRVLRWLLTYHRSGDNKGRDYT